MEPLISVILPTYNNGELLPLCIDSILSQTYRNFELLVINDGSTDGTAAIIDGYAVRDSRVRPFHKENGGVSTARNMGLDNVRGEYVTFVDGDDVVDPAYLELLLYAMNEGGAMISTCNLKKTPAAKAAEFIPEDIYKNGYPCKTVTVQSYSEKVKYTSVYCCAGLYKTSLIGDLRFDTKLHYAEDTMFFFRIFLKAGCYSFIDLGLYFYVYNQDSATHQAYSMCRYDEINTWEKVHSMIEPYGDPIKSAVEQKMVTVYMHFYFSLAESKNATSQVHRELRRKTRAFPRAVRSFLRDKNVSFAKGKLKMLIFMLPPGLCDFIIKLKG